MKPLVDRLTLVALAIAIVALPWPFGSVRAVAYVWYFPAMLGLLAIQMACLATRRAEWHSNHAAWTIGTLGLVWGLVQLVPLPLEAIGLASPKTAEFLSTLSPPLPSEMLELASDGVEPLAKMLNFHPGFGWRACEWLALALGAAWLTTRVAGNPGAARVIIATVFGTAVAIALFGIAQKLNWNGLIYWHFHFPMSSEPFGPFVNRNHAAGYLNLGAAAAVFYVARVIATNARNRGAIDLPMAFGAVAAISMFGGSILITGSRGGMIAMVAAIVVVGGLLVARRSARWGAVYLVVPLAVALLITGWLGFQQTAMKRYSTLGTWKTYSQDGRVLNWRAALRATSAFPLTGTGYGTYRYAFQPFETRDARGWLLHAENVFVETLVEGGVPGFLLLVAGVLLACGTLARGVVTGDSYQCCMSCCGLYAVVSQAVQNCMDWGIYLPSNLLTAAILVAASIRRAEGGGREKEDGGRRAESGGREGKRAESGGRRAEEGKREKEGGRRSFVGMGTGLLLMTMIGLGTWDVWKFSRLEPALIRAEKYLYPAVYRDRPELDEARRDLAEALRADQRSAEAHLIQAKLLIATYERDVAAGVPATATRERQMLSLEGLFGRSLAFQAKGDEKRLLAMRGNELIRQTLVPAREHLLAARRLCSISGEVHLNLARLAFLDDPKAYETHVRRAVRCRPSDPAVLIPASFLYLVAGEKAQGTRILRQVWSLSPESRRTLVDVLAPVLSIEEIAVDVVPLDAGAVLTFARAELAVPEFASSRPSIAGRLRERLDEGEWSVAERRFWDGVLFELEGKAEEAALAWQEAVESPNAPARWHAELARAYIELGNSVQARKELAIAESIREKDDETMAIIEGLRARDRR